MSDDVLSRLLAAPTTVLDRRELGGGCISDVSVVSIDTDDAELRNRIANPESSDGRLRVVIKRNSADMESNFRCEADGLAALSDVGAVHVPTVYGVAVIDGHAYLAMEWIEASPGRGSTALFERFGKQLAELHRTTSGRRIGWHEDNFLGSARQPNAACSSWDAFFAERRIGYQIRWACDQGLVDSTLQSDCETIVSRMGDLLSGRDDATSLLHGDLWSGNYLFDSGGEPVLIDPAVYYGCREAEWGMIKWFGGCPPEFERAYLEAWPMPDGWRRRVQIYLLYHQLNHLNLFGGSYAEGCRRTARDVLR